MGRFGRRTAALALAAGLLGVAAPAQAELKAGAATVDATGPVGASAGQYATTRDEPGLDQELDPGVHSFKNVPSYGVQSRLQVRALVVSDGTRKFAYVKNDLYIPQDLLWRRTAQLLEAKDIGIGRDNLTIGVSHDHSSPYYTSTGAGAWTFQDVFDLRQFEEYAQRMAEAVVKANASLRPARVGAATTQYASSNRNALGPAIADDGSPAGFPDSYTDRTLTLVRFDDVSDPSDPKPLANFVDFGQHGEGLDGNDLIAADWIGPMQRLLDSATGAVTVFAQNATGNSELERNAYHSVHDRQWFDHRNYGQAEVNGGQLARALLGLSRRIERGDAEVPFFTDGPVGFADRWFAGPASHPYPSVSNCRTEKALQGDPQLPVVGLPDCAPPARAFDEAGIPRPPVPAFAPVVTADDLKRAGLPTPDNYGAPSYGALQEDVSVHLQAFRIGGILFTVCSCEQWADQSQNIRSRTDRVAGNEWMGFDWTSYRGLDDTGVECFEPGPLGDRRMSCPRPETARTSPCQQGDDGRWSCPNPKTECLLKGDGFTNTCRDAAGNASLRDSGLTISDATYRRIRAQVRTCANGWNAVENVPFADSEPTDPEQIKGSYTCDDGAASARYGYALTVPIGMANDYNGYITTYREYQRGDHYRKALTAWGPHSSDYLATNLVKLGRMLNGGPGLDRTVDGAPDPDADAPALAAKTAADVALNDQKATALGRAAEVGLPALRAAQPDDGGSPAVTTQPPAVVERFSAARTTWTGGSNSLDDPQVVVQRQAADGTWRDAAGQEGEVVTTIAFPSSDELADVAAGTFEWRWSAHWEAFVNREDLPGQDRATPPGTYRFRIRGTHRTGGADRPYELTSRAFEVRPWSGITVPEADLRDGRPSFAVGPRRAVDVPGGPPAKAVLGPVELPDFAGGTGAPRFLRDVRSAVRDPAAPTDPARIEWYCFDCAFRPWLDVTDAASVVVTFAKGDRRTRVAARRDGFRWTTDRALADGERAYVCPGDVLDPWGDTNATGSAAVGAAGPADCSPPKADPPKADPPRSDPPNPRPDAPEDPPAAPDPPRGEPDRTPAAEEAPVTAQSSPPATAEGCRLRPSSTLRVPRVRGDRVRSVTATVDGRRAKATRTSVRVVPRAGSGPVRVVLRIRTDKGRRLTVRQLLPRCR